MSTYPGNPSLGDEVKRRILATYEQSVGLAESGRDQEAILGCDFVLELDPRFEPARRLKERLSGGAPTPDTPDAPADPPGEGDMSDLSDLPSLDELPAMDDLPDLSDEPAASADDLFDLTPTPPPAPAATATPLAADLSERLAARDFQAVVERASADPDALAADPEAARIAETAQSRLEAQPYVESFLREAGAALRAGDADRADGELAKVRSLDPDHPLLEDLDSRLRVARGEEPAAVSSAPAAAATPDVPPPADVEEPALDLPPADEDDDLDLLGGFDVPDLSDSEPTPSWTPEPSSADDGDDDLFSFEGLGPSDGDAPDLTPSLDDDAGSDAPPLLGAQPSPAAPAASAGAPAEGDGRIAELLAEGDEASAAGDYQGAIDAWSRIFLIDVDHEEAARRIEDARSKKAEREREVEEAFHEGLAALEAGSHDEAKARFERVLAMQPTHLAARDYLRQIESGEPISISKGPSPDETVAMGGLGTFDLSDLASGSQPSEDSALREEILVPPPPSTATSEAADPKAVGMPSYGPAQAKREPGRRSFLLVGGLVLVLVAAAAWWLFSNKDSVFPNSDAEEPAEEVADEVLGPIERATDFHEQGRTAMAIGMLRRIRPNEPGYEEAQDLIARWQVADEGEGEETEASTLSPEATERRQRILQAARAAQDQREYLLASQLLDRADRIAVLEGEALELKQANDEVLEPLAEQVTLFQAGEYERVLPDLWRLHQEDPDNRDVTRMLVTSYYNRGVRELQRGNAGAAIEEFDEALEVDPDDEELRRHVLFAQTYQRRPKDLLYRIYVKYLPPR